MQSQAENTAALFAAVEAQYRQIPNAHAVIHHIEVAEKNIQIHFANETLVSSVMPALEHRSVSPNPIPDLTVHVWDTASTEVSMAKMPWQHEDFTSRREIRGASGEGYAVSYDLYCGIFSIISLSHKRAYWWIHDRAQLPDYERAAPLREILQAFFSEYNGMLIHGASVGNAHGAVVMIGPGGVGKSTTTLASITHQLQFIGEDYCLLTDITTTPHIHSLYSSAKLDANSLRLLPKFADHIINPHRIADEKAIMMLHPHVDTQPSAPIRALLLPSLTDADHVHLTAARSVDVLRALAPSTILQLSGTGQAALRDMKKLVENVPAYNLHLNGNLHQIAPILNTLIQPEPL